MLSNNGETNAGDFMVDGVVEETDGTK